MAVCERLAGNRAPVLRCHRVQFGAVAFVQRRPQYLGGAI
jgi:hypothetical protein